MPTVKGVHIRCLPEIIFAEWKQDYKMRDLCNVIYILRSTVSELYKHLQTLNFWVHDAKLINNAQCLDIVLYNTLKAS